MAMQVWQKSSRILVLSWGLAISEFTIWSINPKYVACVFDFQKVAAFSADVAADGGLGEAEEVRGLFFVVAMFFYDGAGHDGFYGWQDCFDSYFAG